MAHPSASPRASRPGMSLIEATVAIVVLGVAATGMASIYQLQLAQRQSVERYVIGMELANRQLEFLRSLDFRRPYNADESPAPFTCPHLVQLPDNPNSPNSCIYEAPPCTGAGADLRAVTVAGDDTTYLTEGNSRQFALSSHWLVRPPAQTGSKDPFGLVMPQALADKGYYVIVRAARITPSASDVERNLIYYQVMVLLDINRNGPGNDDELVLCLPYFQNVFY